MLQCFKCSGEFHPQIINKEFHLFGVETIQIKDLKLYVCNGCGAELMPDKTSARVKQELNQYLGGNAAGVVPDSYSAI